MADTTNTISTVSTENKTLYEKALLRRLTPELVFAKYGQCKSAPKHEGTTIDFRRFNAITPKTQPLTEGVTPDGSVLYVGDSNVDADTAHNAGLPCCGVLWGFRTREELTAAGAEYLAEDAAALEKVILG